MWILNNDNHDSMYNPDYETFVCPIAEYLNHSHDPNCILTLGKTLHQDQSLEMLVWKSVKDIPIGEQLFVSYGNLSNYHFLQKYGFTLDNFNSLQKFPLYFKFLDYKSIVDDQMELKFKLGQHKKIEDYRGLHYLYDNKFDMNLLKSLRIAFLTSDLINQLTFEHLWNHETFDKPLSIPQEETILLALKSHVQEWYDAVKGKDYLSVKEGLGEIDHINKVHMKNIYTIQHEEQTMLQKNLKFIDQKINELQNN